MKKDNSGFSLIEVIIVIAIIGVLVAVVIVAFKPQEIISNGRNARRTSDINTLNTAIGQWLAREGAQEEDPYTILGISGTGITALNPNDGSIDGEGVEATAIAALTFPAYIQSIPIDPDETTEYRVGIDDTSNPRHVLICTDQIEHSSTYPDSTYPDGIFCLRN